jgi:hypothetical protein
LQLTWNVTEVPRNEPAGNVCCSLSGEIHILRRVKLAMCAEEKKYKLLFENPRDTYRNRGGGHKLPHN